MSEDYSGYAPVLRPIFNDEPLVRSYLLHLLADAQTFDDYKPYIENTYVSEMFAEAKILSGIGDQDKWAAMLPAAKLQALKDRVDLEFAYTNKDLYAPDDKVSVAVNIKNVKTLIVKVYQVNAANYYKTYHREVNTDINLDGLVANEERTVEYKDSPLRLIEHKFDFDKLTGRGVYVIEFIGNGKSSRALIRKGKLRYLERDGAAGQMFTVLDEANKPVKDARLWMAGHEYAADPQDKSGEIQVPYSTNPQADQPIVLESGDFASLDTFALKAEAYRLDAGIYVPRESLIRYATANVVIRPALFLNDVQVSPKLLEEVTLVITSTDLDGVSASKEVPNFKLFEDQQSTYEFSVPDRLKSVTFTLKAKVQNVSLNKKEDLAESKTFAINEIDTTDKIEDLHLSKIDGRAVCHRRAGQDRRGPRRPAGAGVAQGPRFQGAGARDAQDRCGGAGQARHAGRHRDAVRQGARGRHADLASAARSADRRGGGAGGGRRYAARAVHGHGAGGEPRRVFAAGGARRGNVRQRLARGDHGEGWFPGDQRPAGGGLRSADQAALR